MSKKLLYYLNGEKDGKLKKWLDDFNGEPRIAWYPSAGEDFRDLLYLHSEFAKKEHADHQPEPKSPDIFLHTDYFPWSSSNFLDDKTIYEDENTKIYLESFEELPNRHLPLDSQIVDFPQGSVATGRVLFLEISVESDILGKYSYPLVYAFVENAAFCAEIALPQQGKFSHIVHVRFGGGLGGGGNSTGIWLLNVLKKLQCELFITDSHYGLQIGDKRIYDLYPSLAGKADTSQLQRIRLIKGKAWSNHGDVSWNIINRDK